MNDIELREEGSRIYIVGNTFACKATIKAAGGHWDGDRRAWWVGKSKRSDIEAALAGAKPEERAENRPVTVMGKASYKGRSYYVRWSGRCKSGAEKFRLVTLDEKLDFWANADACTWEKVYPEVRSLAGIRRFIQQKKELEKGGECPRCAAMERSGKWGAYCGSGDYDECSLCGRTVKINY